MVYNYEIMYVYTHISGKPPWPIHNDTGFAIEFVTFVIGFFPFAIEFVTFVVEFSLLQLNMLSW